MFYIKYVQRFETLAPLLKQKKVTLLRNLNKCMTCCSAKLYLFYMCQGSLPQAPSASLTNTEPYSHIFYLSSFQCTLSPAM
ncbi:unnamed protein product [Arctogadus glacialis]